MKKVKLLKAELEAMNDELDKDNDRLYAENAKLSNQVEALTRDLEEADYKLDKLSASLDAYIATEAMHDNEIHYQMLKAGHRTEKNLSPEPVPTPSKMHRMLIHLRGVLHPINRAGGNPFDHY